MEEGGYQGEEDANSKGEFGLDFKLKEISSSLSHAQLKHFNVYKTSCWIVWKFKLFPSKYVQESVPLLWKL